MRFTHTSQTDALKHRQVYEHMRNMLGQVVLGSPLHLEEITGVLICSLFAGSPSVMPPVLPECIFTDRSSARLNMSIAGF